ncbi:GGDEF domain-containing protein [Paraburkholderia sediminicola]|uniref:GGDEF domain-containing protein n=1 Tax=Paraburkholderia sediminicola TaxID=458836 RepID=UPI0038B80199
MPIYTHWKWAFLMPKVLHPISIALFGGLLTFIATLSVLYPMGMHQWSNEARNIDAVGRFYESSENVDRLIEGSSTRRPSEYLSVKVTTLKFRSPDVESECISRLSDQAGPLGTTAAGKSARTGILNVCRERRFGIGRYSGPNTLTSMIPVVSGNGQILGARVQITTPVPPPSFLDTVAQKNDLLIISVVTALSLCTSFLLGKFAQSYLTALRETASIDGLTGCLRREAFFAAADHEIRMARKAGRPLTVLAIDLDHLKQINDILGHAGGDTALNLVAQALRATLRVGDLLGRIGGDEFAAILPATSADVAITIAERGRQAVAGISAELFRGKVVPSVSIGLAEFESRDDNARKLVACADRKLYDAKKTRNAVVR